uniref:Uncharacterized protein n=1 Tax=Plectus sambesii TaxID=2011161 RepID=A0A914VNQ0_9BILA
MPDIGLGPMSILGASDNPVLVGEREIDGEAVWPDAICATSIGAPIANPVASAPSPTRWTLFILFTTFSAVSFVSLLACYPPPSPLTASVFRAIHMFTCVVPFGILCLPVTQLRRTTCL